MPLSLEAKGITKAFPGVLANDHVDFQLEKGKIHALLGENGAGKTTLMNILYGLYRPDEGQIFVDGTSVRLNSPNDAIKLGIGMVHQHFMLVPVMTVAENMMLGTESVKKGTGWWGPLSFLDRRRVEKDTRHLSEKYNLNVDPTIPVHMLPVGVQQRVEILKALYRKADILILDEPTAVLTPQEAEELFVIMRSLRDQGVSIIFITHKLKEVFAVADRITVMRAGKVVGHTTPAEATESLLASMMVGREVLLTVKKGPAHPTETVLDVQDLQVKDERGLLAVRNATFQVRQGEVLGIAGVQGNGQTELVEALTGLRKPEAGHVLMAGNDITNDSPRKILETGVSHIPEDRRKRGLVLSYSIADNMVLCTYYKPPFARGVIMFQEAINAQAKRLVKEFDVRAPSIYTQAGTLSGGNQQKVIVARELSRPYNLLVAAQPTRGLDVGSIEFIHKRVIEQRDAGHAVLLVSAELDEILSLSDRVAVMYKGEIIGVVPIEEATRENIGLLMAGITTEKEVTHA